MNILIFIIVLGVLVFVHELGHFLFAKLFGVKVHEFGFGYPPRALTIGHWRGTDITLNWIPFGGFVRMSGENPTEELSEEEQSRSLTSKPRWQQFFVMIGGILFNIIFAWLLISATYMTGTLSSVDTAPSSYEFEETQLLVTQVQQGSPADDAGLMANDVLLEYGTKEDRFVVQDQGLEEFSSYVNEQGPNEAPLQIVVNRNGSLEIIEVQAEEGIIANKYGIGIGLSRVGELQLPFFHALAYGFTQTGVLIESTVVGFYHLLSGAISFDALSGPVGIVSQVGQASDLGFNFLLGFTALLSLNLAVINALPFPALDGGRITIIVIESIIRRPLPAKAVMWVNGIGFLILILLMIAITVNDVTKLF